MTTTAVGATEAPPRATTAIPGVILPGPAARERVAGVPVVARAAILLGRAGARVVLPFGASEAELATLLATPRFPGAEAWTDLPVEGPCVVVAGDVVLEKRTLARVLDEATRTGDLVVAKGTAGFVAAGPSLRLASVIADWRRDRVARAPLDARVLDATAPFARVLPATTKEERSRAARALLVATGKPEDGPLTRFFERRISQAISGAVLPFGVTPNALTTASLAIGLTGAWLLATTDFASRCLGAAIFVFATIADGCDGEVARTKLLESNLGRLYDTAVDIVVNAAVFVGIAVGTWRELGDVPEVRLATGAIVAGGLLAMAVVESVRRLAPLDGAGAGAVTRRANAWLERFATLEWCYLVLALALAGQIPFFLFGAAVGANVFALVYLSLGVLSWRRG